MLPLLRQAKSCRRLSSSWRQASGLLWPAAFTCTSTSSLKEPCCRRSMWSYWCMLLNRIWMYVSATH
jgi:hypothetical protein